MRPGPLALLLAVHAAVVIGAFAFLLSVFGDRLETELDREVDRVERQFDRDVEELRRDVISQLREELDRRLPAAPAPTVP